MGLQDEVFGMSRTRVGQPLVKKPKSSRIEHFFHGTGADLSGQTHLKPSAETGRENYVYDEGFSDAETRKRSVFMTGHENSKLAEAMAWTWSDTGTHNQEQGGARRRVYAVKPVNRVTKDFPGSTAAYMAPSARILHSIDIPPAGVPRPGDLNASEDQAGHVQGTLAPVNWNQFHTTRNMHDRGVQMQAAERQSSDSARMAKIFPPKPVRDPNQGQLFNDKRYDPSTPPSVLKNMRP